jgi:integrase
MDKAKLLKVYAANLERSEGKSQYLKYARDFLEETAGLDRASIDAYLQTLRRKFKPGTVNFHFRVIRRLFAVNEIIWPYRRGEGPSIGQRDEYRPQLSPRVVGMMINAARTDRLFPDEQCFVALSTIYGLRREEISNLRPTDINLKSRAIYIATVKNGRERYHMIPPEIMPYLQAHDFAEVYPVSTLTKRFRRILAKSGAGELKGLRLGWHSIRRSSLDGLVNNGINILAARLFLRWKEATGDMAMPARYYGNVTIDLGEQAPVLEEAKGDEAIFEKHPFLSFWR